MPPSVPAPPRAKPTLAKQATAKTPKNDASPPKNEVARALEDFDAFLDQADIRPSQTGMPNESSKDVWGEMGSGFGNDYEYENDPVVTGSNKGLRSGFGGGSVFGDFEPKEPSEARDGFDLFEPSEVQMTLHELVEQQEKQVLRLHQDLQGQRDVLAVLVDMLVDARILNRKELTKLVKARRQ